MAQLPQGFSARTVEPASIGAGQLPVSPKEGWPVIITGSEMVATSGNANNGMLVLNLRVIEGEHANEEGVYRLNLYHDNPKTVEIANRQLSAVCWVTGKVDAVDSAQLHNVPFRAVVGLQKVKAGEEDKGYTEIKGVLDINGNQPGKTGAAAPASAPQPVAAPAAPPAPAAPAWGQASAPAVPAANAQPAWGGAPAPAAPAWAAKP